jgi:hypothetical protein
MVVDRDMEELIDSDNIEASVENLYNVAMEHGGTDNITNILIKITESTNPTSSFKDVGPKRNKPRNPDFETTNAMQGASEVEEDSAVEKPKSKMLWIGLAASLVIGIAVYFMFLREKPVVGNGSTGGEPTGDPTSITSSDVKKKSKKEMDAFITEINEGKEYFCKDCEEKYKIDNVNYVLILHNKKIAEVREEKSGSPKPTPTPETGNQGDKKTEPVKTEPVKTEPVKSQNVKKPVTHVALKDGSYEGFENKFKSICGQDKRVIRADWGINADSEIKKGKTYTCNCPN